MLYKSYESLESFISDIELCPSEKIDYSHLTEGDSDYEYSFFKTKNFQEALHIARHGFDLEDIKIKIEKMKNTENVLTTEGVLGVSGAVVDMASFLEGVPECMLDFPVVVDKKFIRIMLNLSEPARVSSDVFINRAIATAYLIDHLESNNYRVRLDVFTCASGVDCCFSICVKDYRESLSIGQLAGSMHTSFFRRLCFLFMEKYSESPRRISYGQAINGKLTEHLKQLTNDEEIIILPNTVSIADFKANFDLNKLDEAKKYVEYFMNNKLTLR